MFHYFPGRMMPSYCKEKKSTAQDISTSQSKAGGYFSFLISEILKEYLLLEPAHGLLLADAVLEANGAPLALLIGNAEARSAHHLQTEAITHEHQLSRNAIE